MGRQETPDRIVEVDGRTYPVELVKRHRGYTATAPNLPGCTTQGDTVGETLAMVKDAIRGCVETNSQRIKVGLGMMMSGVGEDDINFLRTLRFDQSKGFSADDLTRLDKLLECVTKGDFLRYGKFEEGKGVGKEEIDTIKAMLGL